MPRLVPRPRWLPSSLETASLAAVLTAVGCTQDFSSFDPTGSGGSGPTTTTSSASTSSDATTGPTTTSSSSGPGGGEGAAGSGGRGGGGPGGAGPGSGGQGGAGGGDCVTEADCDDDNDCTAEVCTEDGACYSTLIVDFCGAETLCAQPGCLDDGVCDPGFLPASTPLADPTDGDCQREACTGEDAAPVSEGDDTDLPADLPCGDRGCSGGAITTQVLADGTACIGEAGFCDGLGSDAASCRVCRDTAAGTGTDAGCDGGAPICDELADAGEGRCVTCLDSAAGSGTDLGCPGNEVCDPAGDGACVDCYTDGGDVAINCADGEVCEPGDGGTCRDCYDLGDGVADAGCEAPLEACSEFLDTCVECQGTADCVGNPNGPDCTESFGTECGCNASSDCTGNAQGLLCRIVFGKDVCGCDDTGDCNAGATACTANVCVY